MGKPSRVFKCADVRKFGLSLTRWDNEKGVSFKIEKRRKNRDTGEFEETRYLYLDDLEALYGMIGDALQANASGDAAVPDRLAPRAQQQPSKPSTGDIQGAVGGVDDDDINF